MAFNYDVNGDGIIDIADLSLLAKFLAGIVQEPEPEPESQPEPEPEPEFNYEPVLTIIGDNPYVLIIGSSAQYNDPGAIAIDIEDGDISSSIVVSGDFVNINTIGTYIVIYTVTDSYGNVMTKNRIVNVIEESQPESEPFPGLVYEYPRKILFLHGGGGNGPDESETDLCEDLASTGLYEFYFPSASQINTSNYPQIGSNSGGGWIENVYDPVTGDKLQTTDPEWVDDAVNYLDNYIDANGPFYAIAGYSQGASMTNIYNSYGKCNEKGIKKT